MTNQTIAGDSLSARIKQALDQLPKAEKQLATMILQSPGQMASYSASEIARLAGVSNATMTRLVRRLGYESYEQMRRLAREGMTWGSPLFLLDRGSDVPQSGGSDPFADHILASTRNINESFAGIAPSTIEEVGRQVAAARQIRVFGQRNNYFFAAYLRWQDRAANQKFFAGEHAQFSKEAGDLLVEMGIVKQLPDMSKLADTRFLK